MLRTFEMFDSDFVLALQLFHLFKWFLLALLLILRLRLSSFFRTSLLFTDEKDLGVLIIEMLWLRWYPAQASELVNDPK